MGVKFRVHEGEPIGRALRRFKKQTGQFISNWKSAVEVASSRQQKSGEPRNSKSGLEFRARKATLLAKLAGQQPSTSAIAELRAEFWQRTGKP
jgi:hypothetical protein